MNLVFFLDGYFLKAAIGGALLSAFAREENNKMFPISWCVVEGENEFSRRWFLENFFENMNITIGLGLTLVSDKQKVSFKFISLYIFNI